MEDNRIVTMESLIDNVSVVIDYAQRYECHTAVMALKEGQRLLVDDLLAFKGMR